MHSAFFGLFVSPDAPCGVRMIVPQQPAPRTGFLLRAQHPTRLRIQREVDTFLPGCRLGSEAGASPAVLCVRAQRVLVRLMVALFTPWRHSSGKQIDLYLLYVARVHIFFYLRRLGSYPTEIALSRQAFSVLSEVSGPCGWLLVSVSSDLLQAPFLAHFSFFT